MSLTVFPLGLEKMPIIPLIPLFNEQPQRVPGCCWLKPHSDAPAGFLALLVAGVNTQPGHYAPLVSSQPSGKVPAIPATTRRRNLPNGFNQCGFGLGLAIIGTVHQLGNVAHFYFTIT